MVYPLSSEPQDISWSSDNKLAVPLDQISVFDTAHYQRQIQFPSSRAQVMNVDWGKTSRRLVSSDLNSIVIVWDVPTLSPLVTFQFSEAIEDLDWNSSETKIIIAGETGRLTILETIDLPDVSGTPTVTTIPTRTPTATMTPTPVSSALPTATI